MPTAVKKLYEMFPMPDARQPGGGAPAPTAVPKKSDKVKHLGCAGKKVDLVLAVDTSEGVGSDRNFRALQAFLKKLIPLLVGGKAGLSSQNTTLALVGYGNGQLTDHPTGAEILAPLTVSSLPDKLMAIDRRLKWFRGYSNTVQAFLASEKLFSEKARPDAVQTLVLVTDGTTPAAFKKQAKDMAVKLKERGVRIVVVGMGEPCLNDAETLRTWMGAAPLDSSFVGAGMGGAGGASSWRDEDELARRSAEERNFVLMPGYTAAAEGTKWLDRGVLSVCEEVGAVELE